MDRVNYLFYQLFLKIKYEKRRYFLYVLSFYVGLLLPTCCIANTRSVEQVTGKRRKCRCGTGDFRDIQAAFN